jgi:hypothetical protein
MPCTLQPVPSSRSPNAALRGDPEPQPPQARQCSSPARWDWAQLLRKTRWQAVLNHWQPLRLAYLPPARTWGHGTASAPVGIPDCSCTPAGTYCNAGREAAPRCSPTRLCTACGHSPEPPAPPCRPSLCRRNRSCWAAGVGAGKAMPLLCQRRPGQQAQQQPLPGGALPQLCSGSCPPRRFALQTPAPGLQGGPLWQGHPVFPLLSSCPKALEILKVDWRCLHQHARPLPTAWA